MGETMKTIIVAFVAALSAAVGETILSYAMKRSGQVDVTESSHWVNLILSVVRNPYVFAGVLFLGVYFFLYLIALSWADLSFVLPLTAVSYIFAAFLAKFFLGEDVSWLRWVGTIVIIAGITLVALDGRQRTTDERLRGTQGEEGSATGAGR
jgi:drug/metabolite transporter (DMT)-like permease